MRMILTVLMTVFIVTGVFSQSGVIREFTGDVELKRSGSAVFVPAAVGAVVSPNTIISTGFRSTAVVVIGSSVITVSPLTRLTLAEIQSASNTENVNVNLQAGRVRVEVNPPAGSKANFTVQSPSATASVRGTTFEMDTNNIIVDEGRVMLNGTGGLAVIVDGGNSTQSTPSGVPANPVDVAAGNLAPSVPVSVSAPVVSAPQRDGSNETLFLTPTVTYPPKPTGN